MCSSDLAATGASGNLFSPALVVTALGLLGTAVSVLGNEASIRYGRRRLVATAMVLSIAIGGSIGFLGSMGYWIAVGLLVFYGMVIWLDSSSLTAGAAGAADPARRGRLMESVGRPLDGYQVRIAAATGEVLFQGGNVMAGY